MFKGLDHIAIVVPGTELYHRNHQGLAREGLSSPNFCQARTTGS
jgi:hypothetical protein